MLYAVAALLALSVGFTVVLVAQMVPARSRLVRRRLAELDDVAASPFDTVHRRRRQVRRERFEAILRQLGEWVDARRGDDPALRSRLVQAGIRTPGAAAVYTGVRLTAPLALGAAALLVAPLFGYSSRTVLLAAAGAAAIGWIAPSFWLDVRLRRRQHDIERTLPDAVDLLVVCVEAGLGLNQAIVRVAEEIRNVSAVTSGEFAMVNLEIRAGTPREDALRNLGVRTGVSDLRSLITMLVQADRFGTSIAHALRVNAEQLRIKRRQRAEEKAAKMPVKMVFPLVLCIFPELMIVVGGPAFIQIFEAFGGAGL